MKKHAFFSRLAAAAAVALTLGTAAVFTACDDDETEDAPVLKKLAAPAHPEAGDATEDALTFSWEGVTGASSYTAQVFANKLGAATRETVTELTTVTFTGLDDNCTYYFRVRANDPVSELRNSVWSEWTEAATDEIPLQYDPLDTPKDPVCDQSRTTATSLTFTWEPVEKAASYTYKLVHDGDEPDRTANVTQTSVSVAGLSEGATYTFSVKANPEEGSTDRRSSSYSKSVKATTVSKLAIPSQPEVTLTMAQALAFEWTEVDGAAGYAYELYEGDLSAPVATGIASADAGVKTASGSVQAETSNTTASFIGLKKDTYYSFRIQAVPTQGSGFIASAFTDYAIAKTRTTDATPLAAPGGIAAPEEKLTSTSAVIVWNAVSGAGSYQYQWGASQDEAAQTEPVSVAAGDDGVLPTEATITGLTASSTYWVRVKTCAAADDTASTDSDWSAWVSFATKGLQDAVTVTTAEEFVAAFGSVKAGGAIEMAAGTYALPEDLEIAKAVTIRAAANADPVLQIGGKWAIAADSDIAALTFEGITMDISQQYLFNIGATVPFHVGALTFKNCRIKGLSRSIFRQQASNDTQTVGAILVEGCIVENAVETGQSYAMFQFSTTVPKALPATVTFRNSTLQVQNLLNQAKVSAPDVEGTKNTITVENCTLYNIGLSVTTKNMLDLGKGGATLVMKNTILGKSAMGKDQSSSNLTREISGLYYASDHGVGSIKISEATVLGEDSAAIFTDPAAGDFSYKAASTSYATLNNAVGDPRWWK